MDREEWRRTVFEISKTVAPGWERWRARIEETTAPVRDWMIKELAPRPGDTVLELAAGAGDTGFDAAAIVGENGRLISTDFSLGDVEEYLRFATDTAGPSAIVLRGLSEDEREAVKAQLDEAFAPFVADEGYELPGVALSAVAS